MKLRIRSSLLGNARFGLVVGLALASGVGCSDDDSVPDFPAPDGGGTESTATMDESSTGGGGNTTDDTTTTSDTGDETLTVNPGTSSDMPTSGETSMPTDSSEPGTDTTDVMTTAPTSDIVDSHTSDLTLPTSEPMSSAGASTSMDTSSGEPLPNLVANGDFEAGTSGWSSWNGTLTASTTKARSGLQSAFQSGGDATGPVSTQVTPIVAGGTYEVTFWASVGSGTAPVRITRYLACADNQYLWVVNDTPVSSDGWTELTGTFTVPEDCDSSSVQVYAEGDTAGVDLYIDDVSVVLLSGPDTGSTDTTSDTGATSIDVDSGVVDTTTPPDETTEMMPDGGVDASSTEPVDTTDEMTDPDASVTTDVMTPDAMTTDTSSTAETTEPLPTSLISNGTFETGVSGWYSWVGTVAASTDKAHSGTQSLLVTGTSTGPAATTVTVAAGETYAFSGWASVGTGSADVRIVRSIADCTLQYEWVVGETTVSSSGWTELTGTFTVPAECLTTSAQIYAEGDDADVDLYLDDVSLTLVPN